MSSPAHPLVDRHARVRSILPRDWWKVSFRSVSWSYANDRKIPRHSGASDCGVVTHPKPPHYHGTLFRKRWLQVVKNAPPAMESELNHDLVGVQGAVDVLHIYEKDAGMSSLPCEEQVNLDPRPLFDGELDETELAMSQKKWDDQVRDLLGSALLRLSGWSLSDVPEEDDTSWDFDILPQTSSCGLRRASPGLTESSGSTESDPPPSTPMTSRMSYADAVFVDRRSSPLSVAEGLEHTLKPAEAFLKAIRASASPGSSLNCADTVISSSSPSRQTPSPISTLDEFEFPSLNPKIKPPHPSERKSTPPPRLQKDENGFYYDSAGPVSPALAEARSSARSVKRASAALLPAFLADGPQTARLRNSSRTRELVDRLRSSSGSRDSGNRARRMDLSGPRASLPSVQDVDEASETDGVIHEKITNPESALEVVPEHGWITGPSIPKTPSRPRGQSASSVPSCATTPTSVDNPSLPPTPAAHIPATFYPGASPSPFNAAFPHPSMASGVPYSTGQMPWQMAPPVPPPGAGPFAAYAWAPPVPPAGTHPFPPARPYLLHEAQGKMA